MKRRSFLQTATSAGVAAGAGVFSILKYPRHARAAAGWGAWPSSRVDAMLPADVPLASSVLELHVNGGMSTFDSFYAIPEWGRNTNPWGFLWLYSQDNPGLPAGVGEANLIEPNLEGCLGRAVTEADIATTLGVTDSAGYEVALGPWAYPFRNRPDVLRRMRIVVTQHNVPAHEGANPVSFTGVGLGQSRMAGLGTPIQRYFMEARIEGEESGIRAVPYSYVLYPGGYAPFNAITATQVGFHPGNAKPMIVAVSPTSELSTLLNRESLGASAGAFDSAVAYYRATYEAQLRAFGHSVPARARERDAYEFANFARSNAPELTTVLSADLLQNIAPPGAVCGRPPGVPNDFPRMQARLSANLLTRAENRARYVMWIDAGLVPSNTGGHDTHGGSIQTNSLNLPHTFNALLEQIRNPDNPLAGDDRRINLDETMVVINTEFGRTPYAQGTTGTNHFPWGYVNVFIGGPIHPEGDGPSVYGTMSPTNGYADIARSVRPAEARMMVLQAMGIYPFSTQSYNVSDVAQVRDELEAANRIRGFLGYDV